MADTVVSSLITANMQKYALFLQDTAGGSNLAYSVDDLRLLNALSIPGAGGVKNGTDFAVVSGPSAGQMTVTSGTGVTTYNGEYYAFRSIGNVTIPVYTNGHAVTVTHILCAQVFDHQQSYTTTAPSWGYVLAEDTGTGATIPSNAIPICSVTVTPGQTSSYGLIDLRYPYQHQMSCAVNGSITGTSFTGSTNTTLSFSGQTDDTWNMWNTGTPTKIYIKQPGLYEMHLHLYVSSVDYSIVPARMASAAIVFNGTTIAVDRRQATTGGATCHAVASGFKIIPSGSTYVEAVGYQNGAGTACSYNMTVQRTEYRAS